MKKSILIALGLMLGFAVSAYSLDVQAEKTGASNYTKVGNSNTRTSIVTGDSLFDGIFVSSALVSSGHTYVQIWDSTSTTLANGTLVYTISMTTIASSGGQNLVADADYVYNYTYKPVTPTRMNKGIAIVNGDAKIQTTIFFRSLGR